MTTPLRNGSMTGHFTPLLATQARRRMAVLAGTTVLFSMIMVAVDVVLPLWVTRELDFTPAQWAHLRSLRMTGVFVGVLVLGALSDRFGQRLLGSLSLFGAAVVLAVFALGGRWGIWLAMPFFGALVSTIFVNMNTLTQQVSARRQGLANTIYRGIGAASTIAAPALATGLAVAWRGYPPVLLASAGVLIAAGVVLLRYPGEATPPPLAGAGAEVRRLWAGYLTAFHQRPFMHFVHLSLIAGGMISGVGAFAAIRFTLELGQTDQFFGWLTSVAGVAVLLATVGCGFFLDRLPLRVIYGAATLASGAASVLMGLGDSLPCSIIGYLTYLALMNMLASPLSMWVSRAAGEASQTNAFSVQKIIAALYGVVSMLLLGVLEGWVGMRAIFLYGGLLGIIAGVGFFLLPEPPAPGKDRRGEGEIVIK
ncbi:MAG: MFS transporter [Armatimonadota bacterium]